MHPLVLAVDSVVLAVVSVVLNSLVLLAENSVVLHHHIHHLAMMLHKPVVHLVRVRFHPPILNTCFFHLKGGYSVESGLAGGAGLVGGGGAGFGGSSYESSSYSSSSGGVGGGVDVASSAFNAADTNKDGVLSSGEFNNFVQGGL